MKSLYEDRKYRINEYIQSKDYHPMKIKQMALMLNVPSDEREDFRDIIKELIAPPAERRGCPETPPPEPSAVQSQPRGSIPGVSLFPWSCMFSLSGLNRIAKKLPGADAPGRNIYFHRPSGYFP